VIVRYLLSHAATLVGVFVSLLLVVRLLDSKRTPQSTFAWLLAIIFVPVVAIPLYLLLGQRKFPQRAKLPGRAEVPRPSARGDGENPVAHVLKQSGVAPARDGNTFELFTDGESAYEALLRLIDGAAHSIDLTMFILGNDATGHAVLDALARRASAGVSVRVILDAVGSAVTLERAKRLLAGAGGEVRSFMPLGHSPVRGRTNLRSHRKLAIFDGEQVFGGGMNLALEYLGAAGAPTPERWVDVAVVVSGPVAADAAALFESDFRYCGGKTPAPAPPPPRSGGEECVQLVPSGPDMVTDTVYDAFLTGIFEARERVAIVTPYYVPDEALQHALELAARRGVRVELVVPSRSNHRLADVARRAMLRELAAAGVIVHYYPHAMVHAKAMVIDELVAYVGSPNFDMRSLFLNYEVALFTYSRSSVRTITRFIDALAARSLATAPHRRENWLFERVARLLAPEL